MPEIAGLKDFRGTVMHSSQYDDGENWKGKRAIVIGTGNSGHDIAQDLHSSGAEVTLFQRSSTLVVSIEPSAQLVYAPYNEGTLEDNDLIATSMPLQGGAQEPRADLRRNRRSSTRTCSTGCERAGFKLDFGEDNTGWQFKYLTRGGGYYFNVGCSDLIVKGDIALKQFADVEGFVADGARMKDGETIAADLVVLATGYKRQEELVRLLFGEAVMNRVGTIWGFGDEPGTAQHVHPHRPARPVVHRRRPRAMPHRLEASGAADQGDRGRVAAADVRASRRRIAITSFRGVRSINPEPRISGSSFHRPGIQ